MGGRVASAATGRTAARRTVASRPERLRAHPRGLPRRAPDPRDRAVHRRNRRPASGELTPTPVHTVHATPRESAASDVGDPHRLPALMGSVGPSLGSRRDDAGGAAPARPGPLGENDRGGTPGIGGDRVLPFARPSPSMDRTRPPADLLTRIAMGDRSAVDACVQRYGGLVWSVVKSVVVDADLAEDAVQDVFVDLWRKAETFDPSKSSESGFVALVARRRAIDVVRRRVRRTRDEGTEDADAVAVEHPGHADVERDDEVRLAQRILTELRPEQQRVLRLSLLDGLSHAQISERIDMPLGTVKTHARRGLAQARALLAERRATHARGGTA